MTSPQSSWQHLKRSLISSELRHPTMTRTVHKSLMSGYVNYFKVNDVLLRSPPSKELIEIICFNIRKRIEQERWIYSQGI